MVAGALILSDWFFSSIDVEPVQKVADAIVTESY